MFFEHHCDRHSERFQRYFNFSVDTLNAWYSLNFVPTNEFSCIFITFFRTWCADLVSDRMNEQILRIFFCPKHTTLLGTLQKRSTQQS